MMVIMPSLIRMLLHQKMILHTHTRAIFMPELCHPSLKYSVAAAPAAEALRGADHRFWVSELPATSHLFFGGRWGGWGARFQAVHVSSTYVKTGRCAGANAAAPPSARARIRTFISPSGLRGLEPKSKRSTDHGATAGGRMETQKLGKA